jgi:malate dehydrogenase (oxaloacetate-decarboxylating)(NADP+)
MGSKIRKQDALDYHALGRPGKIEVVPTKDTNTQRDLALAYSPGVAEPCLAIAANPDDVWKYTAKSNLVAVISNGTAVLGLGDIGPEASKPVMEGKGVLFKKFADIDVFDLELNTKNIDEFVRTVKILEPTFGGINLEDIAGPDCFEIERRLRAELNIPIMHDDQHGTAIISSAGLLNALELQQKKIEEVTFVVSGAGASAIACTKLFCALGARKENIVMLDSKGVIHTGRTDLDEHKQQFATTRKLNSLAEALVGADVFIGLSKGNIMDAAMLKSMAPKPIVFALSNPDPEIPFEVAMSTRKDLILATGRSDYPNQVNNVLGFPYIFRGALDVYATEINEAMKLAAVHALAALARQSVPEVVHMAYHMKNIVFGKDYIIPKPMDPRLIEIVAPAVAKAAIDSGVARKTITDWEGYKSELRKRLGLEKQIMRGIMNRARQNPKRVVFSEADSYKILKAAQILMDDGVAIPILLGNKKRINAIIREHKLELSGAEIIDPMAPANDHKRTLYGELFFEKRKRRGYNIYEARKAMRDRNHFGAMMVEMGEADAFISGLTRKYADAVRPALQIIGTYKPGYKVAGMYILITPRGPLFLADTTINLKPDSEGLYQIAMLAANAVSNFNITPRIAFLSYSNFGSVENDDTIRIRTAVELMKERHPEIISDGEMQANLPFNQDILTSNYPFCDLIGGDANVLIFPNLHSGNIAYKLLQEIGNAEAIGPVLLGMRKPVHILQLGSSVREIVNMVAIAVVDAQEKEKLAKQS